MAVQQSQANGGLSGMKVSTRLIGGFGLLTVLAVGAGATGWLSVRSIDGNLNQISEVAAPAIETADDLIALTWETTKVAEEIYTAADIPGVNALGQETDQLIQRYADADTELDGLIDMSAMQAPLDRSRSEKQRLDRLVGELAHDRRALLAAGIEAREALAAFNQAGSTLDARLEEMQARNEAEMRRAEARGDQLVRQGAGADQVNVLLGKLFENDFPVVRAALLLQGQIHAMESQAREYLNDRDPKALAEVRARFDDRRQSTELLVADLDARLESPKGREQLEAVKADLAAWIDLVVGDGGLFAAHRERVQTDQLLLKHLKGVVAASDATIAELDQVAAAADEISQAADRAAEAAVSKSTLGILALLGAAVVIAAGLVLIVVRTVTNPIKAITGTMRKLADGDTSVAIPGAGRSDEIGEMAGAVQVFKDNALEKERLEVEQKEAEKRAEAEKRQAMQELADRFENEVGGIVEMVSSAATELQATSQQLSAAVEETEAQTSAAASGADQASGSVQTVASAAEQLSAAIQEVNGQVSSAAGKLQSTAQGARSAQSQMDALLSSVGQIDEVVEQISDVAEQTNLLALNATIEAARAGEAGKGFAVVAQEVKSLANQTRTMTDNIASQLAAVKQASRSAVDDTREIVGEVETINETTGAIAASIEQQTATTSEISRSATEAAKGTDAVSDNLGSVKQAAGHTAQASGSVSQAANDLAQHAEGLKSAVQTFLSEVQAA